MDIDFKTAFPILVTIGGWCMTIGMYCTKIKQCERDIINLKDNQNDMNVLLQSIEKQLVELNTKMSLLIKGQIKETHIYD